MLMEFSKRDKRKVEQFNIPMMVTITKTKYWCVSGEYSVYYHVLSG